MYCLVIDVACKSTHSGPDEKLGSMFTTHLKFLALHCLPYLISCAVTGVCNLNKTAC